LFPRSSRQYRLVTKQYTVHETEVSSSLIEKKLLPARRHIFHSLNKLFISNVVALRILSSNSLAVFFHSKIIRNEFVEILVTEQKEYKLDGLEDARGENKSAVHQIMVYRKESSPSLRDLYVTAIKLQRNKTVLLSAL
jgi:hypothetical protein